MQLKRLVKRLNKNQLEKRHERINHKILLPKQNRYIHIPVGQFILNMFPSR